MLCNAYAMYMQCNALEKCEFCFAGISVFGDYSEEEEGGGGEGGRVEEVLRENHLFASRDQNVVVVDGSR